MHEGGIFGCTLIEYRVKAKLLSVRYYLYVPLHYIICRKILYSYYEDVDVFDSTSIEHAVYLLAKFLLYSRFRIKNRSKFHAARVTSDISSASVHVPSNCYLSGS